MSLNSLLRTFKGPFSFFHPDMEDLRSIIPDAERSLPEPQKIFLQREEATPLQGFPVLLSGDTEKLRQALEACIHQEEKLEIAHIRRQRADRRSHRRAWEAYMRLLNEATDNAVASSFGRRYPAILWLYHSIAVSRLFKQLPQRIARMDLEIAREQGDRIKYRILNRYADAAVTLTHDAVRRVADATEDDETELFPSILERMRENVLILSEDHIGPDLAELSSYLKGYLGPPHLELRARLEGTAGWLERQLAHDSGLRASVDFLTRQSGARSARELLHRPGLATYLAGLPAYDPSRCLTEALLPVWEQLLLRLKEYEILLALRRLVVPVQEKDGELTCRAPFLRAGAAGSSTIVLSQSTRPFDFLTSWVQDPLIRRFGLIYDISDFSSILSTLGRSSQAEQDRSYHQVFRFQRRVHQMGRQHRLTLEKYLGDGALFSGRHPRKLLAAALQLQRHYRSCLESGFPFNRGLRIGLNYGSYRLLPIEDEGTRAARRYEFFGQGVVELSRLVTGKTVLELQEIKTFLVSFGYDSKEVDRFFDPVVKRNVDLTDASERSRPFFAYIGSNGGLINEGIVATEAFVSELEKSEPVTGLHSYNDGYRSWVAFCLEEGGEELMVALRRLGRGNLKGLGRVMLYEVADGGDWPERELKPHAEPGLMPALAREAVVAGTRNQGPGNALDGVGGAQRGTEA